MMVRFAGVLILLCLMSGCQFLAPAKPVFHRRDQTFQLPSGHIERQDLFLAVQKLAAQLAESPAIRDAAAPPAIAIAVIEDFTTANVDTEVLRRVIHDVLNETLRGKATVVGRAQTSADFYLMAFITREGRDLSGRPFVVDYMVYRLTRDRMGQDVVASGGVAIVSRPIGVGK